MHLRSVAAKTWMKIKAGPTQKQSVGHFLFFLFFLSNQRGACSPAQAHILLQIALAAARCRGLQGHIRGVHHHICARTRVLNILMSLAGATLCSSSAVDNTTPPSCRCCTHTHTLTTHQPASVCVCVHVCMSAANMDTHWGFLPEQECNHLLVGRKLVLALTSEDPH